MIKSKQLAKVLYELMEEGTQDLEEKFFSFLKEKKLEAQLPSILYHFEKITEQTKEESGIQIEVPHAITEHTAKEIKDFLKASDLEHSIKINKDLLAGFRAKWGGVLYDASFKTSFKKLQDTIIS